MNQFFPLTVVEKCVFIFQGMYTTVVERTQHIEQVNLVGQRYMREAKVSFFWNFQRGSHGVRIAFLSSAFEEYVCDFHPYHLFLHLYLFPLFFCHLIAFTQLQATKCVFLPRFALVFSLVPHS